MNHKVWIMSAALAGFSLVGCDDRKPSAQYNAPAVTPAKLSLAVPATQPVVAASRLPDAASSTVSQAPAPLVVAKSTFRIMERGTPDDVGLLYEFPQARLHINKSDNTAVLYSDDPKTAMSAGYSGNSFYLVIPLDRDEPAKINGYQWTYRALSASEQQDSADGVFLEGQRFQLQPADITVAFQGEGQEIKVAVIGQFTKFDRSARQNANIGYSVLLKGIVTATVDADK